MLPNSYTKLRKRCIMEKEIISFEKSGLPVQIHHIRGDTGKPYRGMHSHPAIEIVAVRSGLLNCQICGEELCVKAGETVLINSNTGHRLLPENVEITYIQVDLRDYQEHIGDGEFSVLYDFMSRTRAKPYLVLSGDGEMDSLFQRICQKYNENSRWYLKAYIYELAAFLYARNFIAPPAIAPGKLEKIAPIVRYVDANYKLPITLEDICTASGYSKFSVCHTFKGVTGATVFDYINYLRIWQAVEELKQRNHAISQIATACGFSSVTYFNRVFKNVMGCSPSVYRKQLRS